MASLGDGNKSSPLSHNTVSSVTISENEELQILSFKYQPIVNYTDPIVHPEHYENPREFVTPPVELTMLPTTTTIIPSTILVYTTSDALYGENNVASISDQLLSMLNNDDIGGNGDNKSTVNEPDCDNDEDVPDDQDDQFIYFSQIIDATTAATDIIASTPKNLNWVFYIYASLGIVFVLALIADVGA